VAIVQSVDASMTVNSKEAFKMVMGMFNQMVSDDIQDSYPLENIDFERQFALETETGQFFYSEADGCCHFYSVCIGLRCFVACLCGDLLSYSVCSH